VRRDLDWTKAYANRAEFPHIRYYQLRKNSVIQHKKESVALELSVGALRGDKWFAAENLLL